MGYDEGEDIGAIYGFKINGIISNEDNEIATTDGETAKLGAISYIDQNADGLIDHSDRVVLGSVTPNWFYGFSSDISGYGIDLSFLFQGVGGNEIVNFNKLILNNLDGNGNVSEESYRGMWTPSNQKGNLPIMVSEGGSVIDESLVENGSYLRLKYFSIGYNLPKKHFKEIKAKCYQDFYFRK